MFSFTISLIALIIGYAIYGRFVTKMFGPDNRPTPAYAQRDGVDYVPMSTWRVFMIQFLNIAGCFADSENYDYILIGANKEEAQTFSDNTQNFIDRLNAEFEYSTQKHPKVVAPLINSDKNDIVKLALDNKIPLEYVRSCYAGGEKHCGKCESCTRLKNALEYNHDTYYIRKLF